MLRHPFSDASAKAVFRLCGSRHAEVDEIAQLSEAMRVGLCLDNQHVVASMIFLQFLLQAFEEISLRLAVTSAYSVGIKLNSNGFYTSDILDHVTDEFSVDALRAMEGYVLMHFNFNEMESMQIMFRNALLHVSLEEPSNVGSLHGYANSHNNTTSHTMRVVIVDDCPISLVAHCALVAKAAPGTEVVAFSSIDLAMNYTQESEAAECTTDLVLLDWEMPSRDVLTGTIFNGMSLANQLRRYDRVLKPFFSPRPLVVMVTSHEVDPSLLSTDGSFEACDCYIQKPLSYSQVWKVVHAACP